MSEKVKTVQKQQELSDRQLVDRLVRDRPILLIPASWWSEHKPGFESEGLWQKPTRRIQCKQCEKCEETKKLSKQFFHEDQWGQRGKCKWCKGGKLKEGESEKKWEKPPGGVLFTKADSRYVGRLNDKQGGDIIVPIERVKESPSM